MTKDQFLDAWEGRGAELIALHTGVSKHVARKAYRAIALKLLEGLEDSGERWSMCSVHPGLHAQSQDCKLTLEPSFRLTLPKEQ